MPRTVDYFAYGMNMDAAGMAARCPRARPLGSARLPGYRFAINRYGVATLVPARAEVVWGVLWRLAPPDEAALDRFEGVGYGTYRKRRLPIRPAAGLPLSALVYLAAESRRGRPRAGYLEPVVRAARAAGLPDGYVRRIERLLAAPTSPLWPAIR